MKKHEAIKKAYDDYPKGTKFLNYALSITVESSGSFEYDLGVFDAERRDYVYIEKTDKWAEIIKDEPLKVENYHVVIRSARELELLINKTGKEFLANYEGMCRNYPESNGVFFINFYDGAINCSFNSQLSQCLYNIIDFDFWAAQNNVDVPRVILTSEDGVPLCVGDKYFAAYKSSNSEKWIKCEFQKDDVYVIFKDTACLDSERFFSTRESCEKWIEEQNKSKKVEIGMNHSAQKSTISKDGQILIEHDDDCVVIHYYDLQRLIDAYKSLQ